MHHRCQGYFFNFNLLLFNYYYYYVCEKEVNSDRGLKIHMTKMKCGGEDQRITSGKNDASQSQENCSPEYFHSTAGLRVSHTQEDNSRKDRIKWLPMGSKEDWAKSDEDVSIILETTDGAARTNRNEWFTR